MSEAYARIEEFDPIKRTLYSVGPDTVPCLAAAVLGGLLHKHRTLSPKLPSLRALRSDLWKFVNKLKLRWTYRENDSGPVGKTLRSFMPIGNEIVPPEVLAFCRTLVRESLDTARGLASKYRNRLSRPSNWPAVYKLGMEWIKTVWLSNFPF